MSERMKPSGIDWIGDIPESWSVKRLKYLGVARNGLTYDPNDISDEGSIVLRSMNVQDGMLCLENIINVNMPIPQQLVLQKDDLLICSRNGSRDLIGKCALIDERAVGETYGAFMCVYRSVYNRFLYYVMQSPVFSFYLGTFLTSTINQLTNENLGNIKTAFISSAYEQNLITDFLDEQCKKIDCIATDLEKQIEILQKYKKSLITETVTKGLDKSVPMKDSGIEWIGDIPEHWCVKKLKYVSRLKTGTTPSGNDGINYDSEGLCWFTPGDFNPNMKLTSSEKYIDEQAIKSENITVYPKNSVLLVAIGATVGKIGYTFEDSYSNQQITAIIPNNILGEYLLYFLSSNSEYIKENAMYTTLPIINNSYLGSIYIVLPSEKEQLLIANYLDEKCTKINSIIESKKEQLAKITQHKKSLIYEYVTGKKRVKGANSNGN